MRPHRDDVQRLMYGHRIRGTALAPATAAADRTGPVLSAIGGRRPDDGPLVSAPPSPVPAVVPFGNLRRDGQGDHDPDLRDFLDQLCRAVTRFIETGQPDWL